MKLIDRILKRIKGAYGLRVGGAGIALMGAFLLIEHIYLYGINSVFGHEHVGMILIMVGIVAGYISNKVKVKQ